MSQKPIPENRGQLSGLGTKMLAGLKALGVPLGITQITEAGFKAILDAFTRALSLYNQARSNQQTAYNLYHAKMADLDSWLTVVRGILVGDFGNRWNTMWAQAGFVQSSTAIPVRLQDRIALVLQLAQFFTDNPSYEVSEKDVTGAQATLLRKAVVDAQDDLQTKEVALETASGSLNTAQEALVKEMRMLIGILSKLLGKNDPRWEGFGLNRPGMKTTPAAPTGLHATFIGSSILLENDPTANADRYRYRRKILGVDSQYKLVGSSRTPMTMLEGVAAGLTMEFIAQAVAGNSQSVASEPITVTMPVAAQPATPARSLTTETAKLEAAGVILPADESVPMATTAPNGNGTLAEDDKGVSYSNGNRIPAEMS